MRTHPRLDDEETTGQLKVDLYHIRIRALARNREIAKHLLLQRRRRERREKPRREFAEADLLFRVVQMCSYNEGGIITRKDVGETFRRQQLMPQDRAANRVGCATL